MVVAVTMSCTPYRHGIAAFRLHDAPLGIRSLGRAPSPPAGNRLLPPNCREDAASWHPGFYAVQRDRKTGNVEFTGQTR